jgi:hypothetical protein
MCTMHVHQVLAEVCTPAPAVPKRHRINRMALHHYALQPSCTRCAAYRVQHTKCDSANRINPGTGIIKPATPLVLAVSATEAS